MRAHCQQVWFFIAPNIIFYFIPANYWGFIFETFFIFSCGFIWWFHLFYYIRNNIFLYKNSSLSHLTPVFLKKMTIFTLFNTKNLAISEKSSNFAVSKEINNILNNSSMVTRKQIKVDDKVMTLEIGHTKDVWESEYGYNDTDYWDFPIEELIDGTIEINEDYVYWLIDGRCYETEEEV